MSSPGTKPWRSDATILSIMTEWRDGRGDRRRGTKQTSSSTPRPFYGEAGGQTSDDGTIDGRRALLPR